MEKHNPGYYTDLADRLRAVESRSKGPLLEEAAQAAEALAELWSGPNCGNCLDRHDCVYRSFMDGTPVIYRFFFDRVPVYRFNCILYRRDEDV